MKSKFTTKNSVNNDKRGIHMSKITGILIVIGTMALVLVGILTLCGNQIDAMAKAINERIDMIELRHDSNLTRVETIQMEHIKQITTLQGKIDAFQTTLNRIDKKIPWGELWKEECYKKE